MEKHCWYFPALARQNPGERRKRKGLVTLMREESTRLLLELRGPIGDLQEKVAGRNGKEWFDAFNLFLQRKNPWASDIRLRQQFTIVVPDDYDSATWLSTFVRKYRESFRNISTNISDENSYCSATSMLEPGQRFTVKLFELKESVDSATCVAFLKSQGAVFIGVHGAALVWEQHKDKLLNGGGISFINPDVLGTSNFRGNSWVFYVARMWETTYDLIFHPDEPIWHPGDHYLLCFIPK